MRPDANRPTGLCHESWEFSLNHSWCQSTQLTLFSELRRPRFTRSTIRLNKLRRNVTDARVLFSQSIALGYNRATVEMHLTYATTCLAVLRITKEQRRQKSCNKTADIRAWRQNNRLAAILRAENPIAGACLFIICTIVRLAAVQEECV